MSRQRGSLRTPSYRLHKPSGNAVVTIDGRDHYLGTHGSAGSKGKYNRLIAEWLARGRISAPTGNAPGAATVDEIVAGYMCHLPTTGVRAGTIDRYRVALRPLRRMYGNTLAADFGPLKLLAYRAELVNADAIGHNRKRGHYPLGRKLVRRTINCYVSCVRSMFRWAVERELVPPSLCHALECVGPLLPGRCEVKDNPEVGPADGAAIDAVMDNLVPRVRAMVELQLLTGMRSGEMCRMRTCDIDTGRDVWVYRPAEHKTQHLGKDRVVYIGPRAQEILRPLLKPDMTAFIFTPAESLAEYYASRRAGAKTPAATLDRMKTNNANGRRRRAGRPLRRRMLDRFTTGSYAQAIRCALRRVNRDRAARGLAPVYWHPHQLRHNTATEMLDQFDMQTASAALGHASENITAKVYAKVKAEKVALAVAKIG